MQTIENIIWLYLTIPLLLSISLFFTIMFKFPQFRFNDLQKSILSKRQSRNGLSPMATLMIALSARIGIGTLAGTGVAIAIGGAGSVFWMYLSALLTSAATYVEDILAHRYKRKKGAAYYGGPAIFIRDGLGFNKMAGLYALLLMITYTLGFAGLQMNTMVYVSTTIFHLPAYFIAVIITVFILFIITKNVEKIAKIIAKLMPFIAILFLSVATLFLITHYKFIPVFFSTILYDAFRGQAFVGGGIGSAILIGIKRGIFSNEAGLGIGSHAAALSDQEGAKRVGHLGILGIYLTTFVAVTLVAFMILATNAPIVVTQFSNGIEFLQYALLQRFGLFGDGILFVFVFTFGFSTIITAYLYGEMNLMFLTNKKSAKQLLRFALISMLLVSGIVQASFIWRFADIGVGLTALINLGALWLLRSKIHE